MRLPSLRCALLGAFLLPAVLVAEDAKPMYPDTKKGDQIDDYHGVKVADPYRWLEDDQADDTKAWVKEENKVTYDYLGQIPYRDAIKKRLQTLWNYEKYSAPFKEGKYTYFYKNDGLQSQSVLWRQVGDGTPEVVCGPDVAPDCDPYINVWALDGSRQLSTNVFAFERGFHGGVRVAERRPMPPLGHFSLIRFARREG